MFYPVDGCAICEKLWQGAKWGWRAYVSGSSAGPFACGPVPGEDGCPGPHLWLPGWVPHHRSVFYFKTRMDLNYCMHNLTVVETWCTDVSWLHFWKYVCVHVRCICSLFSQTTITTSLILSCLALSEEFLCHTIHAAACRPQVSHIQQTARLSVLIIYLSQYIWDIILSCNSMKPSPFCLISFYVFSSVTVFCC